MKFSIITVCLNAGDDLTDTVSSVLNQTYDDYELIIKDGISTDGSIEKLPENSHIKLIQCEDSGIYDAMNQGIKEAEGDYCIFINAGDTLYGENTLQEIIDLINLNTGDFYFGKSYTVSSGVVNYAPAIIDKYYCFRTTMCHQAMVIKSSFLKKRGYNTNYKITADREWMVYGFVKAKMKFTRMPMFVSNYKGEGISYGNSVYSTIKEETERINKEFFTKQERALFLLKRAVTFPKLRRLISTNPKFKEKYYKIRYKYLSR